MYPSASLLGNHKDESIAGLPVEELIEKADGFAGVFPGWCFKYSGWPEIDISISSLLEKKFLLATNFYFPLYRAQV